jgi:hypothetical protein
MTRDDIIRMAREAGGDDWGIFRDFMPEIERFAHLVAAAERERIKWDSIHSCHPECDKPVCVAIRAAVAAEREACAQIVGMYQIPLGNSAAGEMACEWTYDALKEVYDAIRARREQ